MGKIRSKEVPTPFCLVLQIILFYDNLHVYHDSRVQFGLLLYSREVGTLLCAHLYEEVWTVVCIFSCAPL